MNRQTATIAIVGGVVVLLIGAGVTIEAVTAASRSTGASGPTTTLPVAPTASRGATPAPISTAGASHPAPSSGAHATSTPTAHTQKTITPFVSYTQVVSPTSIEVGASIADIVESSGTCTLTATKAGISVSGTFAAEAQSSSTQCASMTLSSAQFGPGTWNIVVSYSSPTSHGTSATSQVTL